MEEPPWLSDAKEMIRTYRPETEVVVLQNNRLLHLLSFDPKSCGSKRMEPRIVDYGGIHYSELLDYDGHLYVDAFKNKTESSFGSNASHWMPPIATTTYLPGKAVRRWNGYGEDLQRVFTYFKLGDPSDWAAARKAWQKAALPDDGSFLRGNYRDIISVLEPMRVAEEARKIIRARPKNFLRAAIDEDPALDEAARMLFKLEEQLRRNSRTLSDIKRLAGTKLGGSHSHPCVNGPLLCELRIAPPKWTQEKLAEKCKKNISTIQRGEASASWEIATFEIIATVLSEKRRPRIVTPDDLKL